MAEADTPQAPTAQPITLHIPPSLQAYNKSAAEILVGQTARGVAVGAFVFAHPADDKVPKVPYLLLIQRQKEDGKLAGKWEIPGGGCETTDPTVLHSAARELYEEAGLHMTSAVDKVGADSHFMTRSGLPVMKLSFEVRVQEKVDGVTLESIPVQLSHEHQGMAWATEHEILVEGKYSITHPEQLEKIREAFQQHQQRLSVD